MRTKQRRDGGMAPTMMSNSASVAGFTSLALGVDDAERILHELVVSSSSAIAELRTVLSKA